MFHLSQWTDLGLVLLRLMVGAVLFTSGWNTLNEPDARNKNIEMNKPFAIFWAWPGCWAVLALCVESRCNLPA
jgi:uncharacterized membrane protein YphA (DoxX/SURF4 family)